VLSIRSVRSLIFVLLMTVLLASCGTTSPRGSFVWIDVPLDGHSFPSLQPVNVQGHATGEVGITRIELFVDGELWTTIDDPLVKDDLASFQAEWLPPGLGSYTIHAIAYGPDGAPSEYDEARISFGVKTPTPVITVTPVISITPTLTDTPTPLPQPLTSTRFWADAETIDAGTCTDIHWQAENVASVVFGGVDQALEGSFEICLCKSETYTLTVNHLDGSVEKQKLNISVVGSCAVEDTTPPPAPFQAVPANGLSMACKSKQNLVWQPVSDESGISQYQVQVQRHSGDNNWANVSGSTFTGIGDKQMTLNVECGWTYRWRVLAVDGAGNPGPWSPWWSFVDNLE
jgi:hypothetical protein